MKSGLKKISAFLLLLIGFMPVLFAVFFLYKQQEIRHEMKEKLEEEMLHTIVIPAKQLLWIKYGKEIRVGDKMFDIKSMRVENDKYIFTGLYDEEETALNNYLEKHTDKNNDDNQLLSSLFELLESSFISEETNSLVNDSIINNCSLFTLPHITFPYKDILTPPPQQVSTYS